MNLDNILQQFLNLAGTFSPHLVIFLFLLCSIGEFSIITLIPYALDTIWLLSGYHLSIGVLSPIQLILLWLTAQVGRQIGALMLYVVGRYGTGPLSRFYRKHVTIDTLQKISHNNSLPVRLVRRINIFSPFSVALGRLLWLRFPLTLTLGARRQYKVLFLGVLFSSLVWDGVYISVGVAGAQVVRTPVQMLVYSLIGLTAFYLIMFAVRYLLRLLRKKGDSTNTER